LNLERTACLFDSLAIGVDQSLFEVAAKRHDVDDKLVNESFAVVHEVFSNDGIAD